MVINDEDHDDDDDDDDEQKILWRSWWGPL